MCNPADELYTLTRAEYNRLRNGLRDLRSSHDVVLARVTALESSYQASQVTIEAEGMVIHTTLDGMEEAASKLRAALERVYDGAVV